MYVFFYGLFMDEKLLADKGITPSASRVGFVDGYALRIGERAALVRRSGGRVYGVLMDIESGDVEKLYADDSVADYVPEPVNVKIMDGARVGATCYNLPADKIMGTNVEYAHALLEIADKLEFPESYLAEVRNARA